MRIENEMLSRFNTEAQSNNLEMSLSQELDFFFDNVMDTVVDYFILKKKLEYKVRLKNIHFTFRGGLNKTVFLLFWRRR